MSESSDSEEEEWENEEADTAIAQQQQIAPQVQKEEQHLLALNRAKLDLDKALSRQAFFEKLKEKALQPRQEGEEKKELEKKRKELETVQQSLLGKKKEKEKKIKTKKNNRTKRK